MTDLLDRSLLFVTGKGGVGKSTVAAALGVAAAQQGKRTLLCEVDAKGDLAQALETTRVGWKPVELQAGLFAMSMSTEESLKEYLRLQLRIPLLGRIGPFARSLDFVANAAPGVKEILTVGKLAYEVREKNWDLVVVDAVATGHIIGQLAAPQGINDLVQVGIVREQTSWMLDILRDPAVTGAVVVSAPEEMPVTETLELVERLRNETVVDLAAVVVNRVLPELFGKAEEEVFYRLREADALAALTEAAGKSVSTLLDAAELAVGLRRSRAGHLDRLREGLDHSVPVLYLPFLFTRTYGVRTTTHLAEAIAAELGY